MEIYIYFVWAQLAPLLSLLERKSKWHTRRLKCNQAEAQWVMFSLRLFHRLSQDAIFSSVLQLHSLSLLLPLSSCNHCHWLSSSFLLLARHTHSFICSSYKCQNVLCASHFVFVFSFFFFISFFLCFFSFAYKQLLSFVLATVTRARVALFSKRLKVWFTFVWDILHQKQSTVHLFHRNAPAFTRCRCSHRCRCRFDLWPWIEDRTKEKGKRRGKSNCSLFLASPQVRQ